MIDIAHRLKTTKASPEREEQHQLLLACTGAAIFVLGDNGAIAQAEGPGLEALDTSPAEAIGRPLEACFAGDPAVAEAVRLARDEGQPTRLLVRGFVLSCCPGPRGVVAIAIEAASRDERLGLLARVSHELRTPLTPVRGFLDLVANGWLHPDEPEGRELLASARLGMTRLIRLLDNRLQQIGSGRDTATQALDARAERGGA